MSDRIGVCPVLVHSPDIPSHRPEETMSRRFITLLERAARMRQLLEREQRRPGANIVRLMRLRYLDLRLAKSLRQQTAERLVSMASAPRRRPDLLFATIKATPTSFHRW
jgi:hypothetical protein